MFTSDEDLKSSLSFPGQHSREVLTTALQWCEGREGYKTKAAMLVAALKREARAAGGDA